MTPAIPLQAWQRAYVEDDARRKLLVKSVQVGGSFVASLEVALDSFARPNNMWIMLSASDRQSIELMEKIKVHTSGAGVVVDNGFFEDTSIVQHTARFPNNSRIIALPANADTARGFSGNVLLDEFAIHRDAKAIWKAMVGRTMRGFKLRVLSSFKGKQNKFFELAKELGLEKGVEPVPNPVANGTWSGHWVDIYMAVRQGLPIDIDELRRTVGDDDIFDEEFRCVPVDGAMEFIPLELILACESPAATTDWTGEARPGLYFGFDIARKRDLSGIWILELLENGDKLTRGVVMMRAIPFHEQKKIAREIAAVCERGCIDATGIGANLAEDLGLEFPGKIEAVTFNGENKERMAIGVKTAMEARQILLPESLTVRRSMQAVKRFTGATGNIRFDAARTDQGHADEFWALALANAATEKSGTYVPASEGGTFGRTVMGNLMEATF